ncbi:MAG: FkbM family methyltransferase [Vampirovibrio sp.]|nr:FkbM family methyltransferase [Vampirovibrio sp.]
MPTLQERMAAGILRHYPLLSGCGTLGNLPLLKKLSNGQQEVVWAPIASGYSVLADLSDFDGRAAYFAGDIDRKITVLCRRILRPGDIAFDIGANMGTVTLNMARFVGTPGQVYSFEPNPILFGRLEKALAYNHIHHVQLFPNAVGAEKRTLQLQVPLDHSGCGSLVRNVERSDTQCFDVSVVRISDVAEEHDIPAPRLVKIDVEGFEASVLKGAQEFFSKCPPRAILIELNEDVSSVYEHESIQILQALGYKLFEISKSFLSLHPQPLGTSKGRINDFLAIHQGPYYSDIAKRCKIKQ